MAPLETLQEYIRILEQGGEFDDKFAHCLGQLCSFFRILNSPKVKTPPPSMSGILARGFEIIQSSLTSMSEARKESLFKRAQWMKDSKQLNLPKKPLDNETFSKLNLSKKLFHIHAALTSEDNLGEAAKALNELYPTVIQRPEGVNLRLKGGSIPTPRYLAADLSLAYGRVLELALQSPDFTDESNVQFVFKLIKQRFFCKFQFP